MRITNKQKRLSLALIVVFSLMMLSVTSVAATASLSPSSGSAILDFPFTFTATGLDDSDQYDVSIDGAVVQSDLVCTTAGVLQFTVSISTAGAHTVALINNASATVCSASLNGMDIFAVLVPAVVLIAGMTILFGVVKEIKI